MSFLRMSASHSEGNDFDFFETLETTGPLSYARCQVKEADQRLQSSPSNFIVLMITSSSAGKEPTSNAGDPGSISASGRSPGEGIGYPLQHSWASLVAQLVSACNAGDLGSIPGLGRSTGEGIGYPLQHSWASLVAQLVKNLPAMWETWV